MAEVCCIGGCDDHVGVSFGEELPHEDSRDRAIDSWYQFLRTNSFLPVLSACSLWLRRRNSLNAQRVRVAVLWAARTQASTTTDNSDSLNHRWIPIHTNPASPRNAPFICAYPCSSVVAQRTSAVTRFINALRCLPQIDSNLQGSGVTQQHTPSSVPIRVHPWFHNEPRP